MPAYVTIHGGPYRGVLRATVRRWADRMLAELGLETAELSLLLTNDEEIRQLNRQYRRKDRATDVLAFAMREGTPESPGGQPSSAFDGGNGPAQTSELLGDVIISILTAEGQAKTAKHSLAAELRMLLAHGLLHLVGYDHQTDEQDRAMKARASSLCRAACKGAACKRKTKRQ